MRLKSFYGSYICVGGGPGVVVSTAAFHARDRGSVLGLGGLKETKLFLPHPRVKVSIVGSLRDREVACRPPVEFRVSGGRLKSFYGSYICEILIQEEIHQFIYAAVVTYAIFDKPIQAATCATGNMLAANKHTPHTHPPQTK